MRYLTLGEALDLYRRVMTQSGGASGIRSLAALESALAQARATFGGKDLYPSLVEKTAAWDSCSSRTTLFLTATSD